MSLTDEQSTNVVELFERLGLTFDWFIDKVKMLLMHNGWHVYHPNDGMKTMGNYKCITTEGNLFDCTIWSDGSGHKRWIYNDMALSDRHVIAWKTEDEYKSGNPWPFMGSGN